MPQELVSKVTTNVRLHVVNNRRYDNSSFTQGAGIGVMALLGEGMGKLSPGTKPPHLPTPMLSTSLPQVGSPGCPCALVGVLCS